MTARLVQRPGEPADLLIRSARVVDPGSGLDGGRLDVRVAGGAVAEIGERLEPGDAETIDADGLVLTPGLVDPHVHLRTPGDEDEESVESGTRAAAAGGFVAILAMPNTSPPVDSAAVLGSLREIAGREAHVAVGFLAAISKGQEGRELVEMGELADTGAAGFSDDGHPVDRAGLLRRALQYAGITGRKLALHEEDRSLARGGHVREGAVSAELGLRGWPSIAESTMVARDLAIARYEGAPLHVCHVSAAESVAEIRRAKALGVAVTAEVTPHHLCLTDEATRSLDPALKMNPPLGTAADRAALVEALADGTLDCVATDHAPHRAHEKEQPFEAAPYGTIGLETAFAALYTHLVEPGLLSFPTLVERMSAGPAAAFGLPAPSLRAGAPASLALWDLREAWRVEPPYASRSANSAFGGRTLRGRCLLTVAGGVVAHRTAGVAA